MSIPLGIGIKIGSNGYDWLSYWSNNITDVLFFGLYSEISSGQMPNRVTDSSDYLTVAGAAGSETYQCPNTAPYIAADTDYIWFKTDTTQRTTTTAELIGYDLQRTPVKYDDAAPNAIVAIMILKAGVTLSATERNNLFADFWLSVWWDDAFSDYGHIKDNRGAGQQLWTPEAVYTCYDTFTDTNGTSVVAHTMDAGAGWAQLTANEIQIYNNKLHEQSESNAEWCYVDSGKADPDISLDIDVPDSTDYYVGIQFRYADGGNYWRCCIRRAGGAAPEIRLILTDTVKSTVEILHAAGTGTLRVVATGSFVDVYWKGIKVIDAYNVLGSLVTYTEHGVWFYRTLTYAEVFVDNFIII